MSSYFVKYALYMNTNKTVVRHVRFLLRAVPSSTGLFYVLLTVHPNIKIVFFYQLEAQILYFNTFITFLYMFRALLCSSSEGQNCVSTASGIVTVFGWLFSTQATRGCVVCVLNGHPERVTITDAVLINCLPEDEHNSARNMYRNVINVLK